jgi:hypothetical protein
MTALAQFGSSRKSVPPARNGTTWYSGAMLAISPGDWLLSGVGRCDVRMFVTSWPS